MSNGWVTCAGNYLLGRGILDLLREHATDNFTSANQLLQEEYPRLKDSIHRRTGLNLEQLGETVVMGAPFGPRPAAWIISFDSHRATSNPAIGSYVANWPEEVAVEVRCDAEREFGEALQGANGVQNIGGIVKALVRLVAKAARHSAQVGCYSQVGITVGSSSDVRDSFYVQGKSVELLAMSESQLNTYVERLTSSLDCRQDIK